MWNRISLQRYHDLVETEKSMVGMYLLILNKLLLELIYFTFF